MAAGLESWKITATSALVQDRFMEKNLSDMLKFERICNVRIFAYLLQQSFDVTIYKSTLSPES